MAMFPDVQRRACEELDSLLGGNRLPDFSDRETLIYLDALLLETLRWNPTVPLGNQFYLFHHSSLTQR